MQKRRDFMLSLLLGAQTLLQAESVNLQQLEGDWHLRVMDGKEVRKARAILDFKPEKMLLEGFDGCNRISGKLIAVGNGTYKSKLMTTRMACRETIHQYVSSRLHETIREGFTIEKGKRYGIIGITLKGKKHKLFFKRMGK
ncbi:META domain-containing protein [Sulfurovum sp. ST-21]|uniref:META domain-containing protein n=1 Tax=Sulfurovum indicum TaxID=2779528 RepID=A0A7M1S1T2_9BACT|nr:META domain-containing protein [Sulfurovum indicum]QOR61306.1 META domain-containing protein [Sulfurovum indicum]